MKLDDSAAINWGGGVNLNADARSLRRDQIALSKNAFPALSGTLDKRPGMFGMPLAYAQVYPFSIAQPPSVSGYNILMHYLNCDASTPTLKLLAGTMNPASIVATPTFLTDAQVQSLGPAPSDIDPVQFINYLNRTIAIVPGLEGFYHLVPKITNDGYEWIKATFNQDPTVYSGVATLQLQSTPVMPRVAGAYRQRMWYANFGAGKGNWIIAADRVSATHTQLREAPLWAVVGSEVLAYNGRYVALAQIDGEDITAMNEISLQATGSQIDTIFMVQTKKSTLFITGEFLQTFDTGGTTATSQFGDFKPNKVNYSCGCVGHMAFTKTPYGCLWIGPDDVWMMAGNAPVRIGTNIRPALQACPEAQQKHWSIAYANGVAILSIVTAPFTADDGSGNNTDVYVRQQWWLDLRMGPPTSARDARWFGPMESDYQSTLNSIFSPILGIQDRDGKEKVISLAYDSRIVGISLIDHQSGSGPVDSVIGTLPEAPMWVAGTAVAVGDMCRPTQKSLRQGRLWVCKVAGTTDSTEPVWDAGGSDTADNTVTWADISGYYLDVSKFGTQNDFQTDIRSRDETFGDFNNEKKFTALELNVDVSKAAAVIGNILPNQGELSKSLGPATLAAQQLVGGVSQIGVGVIGSGGGQSRTLRPSENTRIHGRQFQAQIQESNSYVIDGTNDYINFTAFSNSGTAIIPDATYILQAKLTHGTYATLSDLMTHIVSKLNGLNIPSAWLTNGTWSKTSPFSGSFPYLNRLELSYSANSSFALGFIHAPDDAASVDADVSASFDLVTGTIVGDGGSTVYAGRCKRLLSLIGFDTSYTTFTSDLPVSISSVHVNAPSSAYATLSRSAVTSDYRWYATGLVHSKANVNMKLISAAMFVKHKAARPLQGSTR